MCQWQSYSFVVHKQDYCPYRSTLLSHGALLHCYNRYTMKCDKRIWTSANLCSILLLDDSGFFLTTIQMTTMTVTTMAITTTPAITPPAVAPAPTLVMPSDVVTNWVVLGVGTVVVGTA